MIWGLKLAPGASWEFLLYECLVMVFSVINTAREYWSQLNIVSFIN